MSAKIDNCRACGHLIALVNVDKLRGVVGLSYGWVHVTRTGRLERRRHVPVGPS